MKYRYWIVAGILILVLGGLALYAANEIQVSCFEEYEIRAAGQGTFYICGILFPPN